MCGEFGRDGGFEQLVRVWRIRAAAACVEDSGEIELTTGVLPSVRWERELLEYRDWV